MQTEAPDEIYPLIGSRALEARPKVWVELLKLAAPSFYVPLTTLADHYGFVTRDYRLIVIGLVTSLTGLAVARILGRLGLDRPTSVNVVVIALAVVAFGGNAASSLPGKELGTIILLIVFLAALVRLRRPRLVEFAVMWLGLALWLWMISALVVTLGKDNSSLIGNAQSEIHATLDDAAGDVVVLILDEYPNLDFFKSLVGDAAEHRSTTLEQDGFTVHGSLPVSYAFTELALPSFFMLNLPAREGDILTEATRSDLLAVVGGENPFVRGFKEAGYRITIVESGWSGLRCMGEVDRCVVRSWYDEVTASVLGRSLAGALVADSLGSPFSHGTDRVMRWIDQNLPAVAGDDHDDLVILHVMLPHTPMAYSSNCERLREARELSVAALIDQVDCANRIIDEVSSANESGRVTLVMGDHGTKLLGQTELPALLWDEAMVAERMRTLVAVRGLDGCKEPSARTSANVSIRLLRCMGADIDYLPDVSYATSVHGEPLVNVYPP